MFGNDRSSQVPSPSNSNSANVESLLSLADAAHAQGRLEQSAYLYLAAFNATEHGAATVAPRVLRGLQRAWDAACQLKDRSLAEHIFEKLETFSTGDEIARYAEALQRLALDKLEEFGLSREDLQEMADMVSEDFADAMRSRHGADAMLTQMFTVDRNGRTTSKGVLPWPPPASKEDEAKEADEGEEKDPFDATYRTIAGYQRAIAEMERRGIGLSDDENFKDFIDGLSRRHGLESPPNFQALIFSSIVREDANLFMAATATEIGGPVVRMYMEQTPLGVPVLCVVASHDFRPNLMGRSAFNGPGVLVMEDIDTWGTPFSDAMDDSDGFGHSGLSRGAREAMSFIRSAANNPEVTVLASCGAEEAIDPYFFDLIYPSELIHIDLPDDAERKDVWKEAFALYPSLRGLDIAELVRLSANMGHSEIHLAAREAVEQAYVASVEKRAYMPVSRDIMYEKVASFQPLDSGEYRDLEDAMVQSLRDGLDDIDDLLKGSE